MGVRGRSAGDIPHPPVRCGVKPKSVARFMSIAVGVGTERMFIRLTCLLLVVMVAVMGCSAEGSGPASTPTTEATGTEDDWLGAVCKLGTWEPTGDLAELGVVSSADSDSVVDTAVNVAIWQFESEFTMRNTMSKMVKAFVYTFTPTGNTVWAASVLTDSGDTSALDPLKKFGFTISKGPIK